MAEKRIGHNQIIEENVFKNAADSATVLLDKINLLIAGVKKLSSVTAKKISIADPKTIADADKISKATQKMDLLAKANERLEKEQSKLAKQAAIVNERTREQRQVNALAAKAAVVAKDSLAGQRIELLKLQKQYDKLSAAQRNNNKVGGPLLTRIKALTKGVTQLEEATGRHQRSVGRYSKALRGLGGGITKLLGAFGLVGGVLAFGRAITDTFRRIREFDKEMQNMAGIAGLTRKELKETERTIRKVAGASTKTSNEVAQLATTLFALGKTQREVKQLLKPVNDLSIALGATSDEAGELLVQTLNAFGEGSDKAEEYANIIANIRASTALDFQRIKVALGFLAPVAKAAGVSFEKTGAILGVLVDNGIRASRAGRLMSTSFLKLASEGSNLEKALAKINKAQKENISEGELLSLATRIFGKESAALGLILANNTEKTAELTEKFEESQGVLERLTEEQLKSLDAQFKILDSTWEEFILSIDSGSGIVSFAIRGIIKTVIRLIKILQADETELQKIIASTAEMTDEQIEKKKEEADKLIRDNKIKIAELNKLAGIESKREKEKRLERDTTAAQQFKSELDLSIKQQTLRKTSEKDNVLFQKDAANFIIDTQQKLSDALATVLSARAAIAKEIQEKSDAVQALATEKEKKRIALLQKAIDERDNEFEAENKLFERRLKKAELFDKKKEDLSELEKAALESLELTHQEKITAIIKKFTDEQTKIQVAASDAAIKADNAEVDNFIKNREKAISENLKLLIEGTKDEKDAALEILRFKKEIGTATKAELSALANFEKSLIDKREKEAIESAERISDAIVEGLEQRIERERQLNTDKLSELDKQIQFQQGLAIAGEKNTLGALEKERAKALEEKAAIEKKAARQKEAEQLAEIFLEFMKVFASEKPPDAAFGKALAATAKAAGGKALVKALAGSFAGGVEDFKGKGTGTSDSNIIGFSDGESVTTAKGTKETPGLVTSVNERGFKGAQEWAMKNVFPKMPVLQDKSKDEQILKSMLSVIHSDNKEIIKTIKNKTEWTISENLFGEIVKARKQNGITTVTTVKNTPIITGK